MPLSRLGTEQQRRYNIGRVLREKKVFGLHPKECVECAFDIAGPASGSVLADAEVSWSLAQTVACVLSIPLFSTCSLSSHLLHLLPLLPLLLQVLLVTAQLVTQLQCWGDARLYYRSD